MIPVRDADEDAKPRKPRASGDDPETVSILSDIMP